MLCYYAIDKEINILIKLAMTKKQKKEKYKNAILYFSKHLNKYQLGKTKLAKLLYYLDFINYREKGDSVTGTEYYKQDYGPLARDLPEMISDLVEKNDLEVERLEINGKQRHKFKALSDIDESVFNEDELMLLRKLKNHYADWSTSKMVAKTHLEAPWVQAKEGGKLSYELAVDVDDFDREAQEKYEKEDQALKEAFDKVLPE
jgi:uncharacterized phage-associated protein